MARLKSPECLTHDIGAFDSMTQTYNKWSMHIYWRLWLAQTSILKMSMIPRQSTQNRNLWFLSKNPIPNQISLTPPPCEYLNSLSLISLSNTTFDLKLSSQSCFLYYLHHCDSIKYYTCNVCITWTICWPTWCFTCILEDINYSGLKKKKQLNVSNL